MTKAEFISLVAEKADFTKKDVGIVTDAVFEVLAECLTKGESIAVNKFGTFSTTKRAEREARVPGTDKVVNVPATTVVKFKVSSVLKDKVAEAHKEKEAAEACKTGKCKKKK